MRIRRELAINTVDSSLLCVYLCVKEPHVCVKNCWTWFCNMETAAKLTKRRSSYRADWSPLCVSPSVKEPYVCLSLFVQTAGKPTKKTIPQKRRFICIRINVRFKALHHNLHEHNRVFHFRVAKHSATHCNTLQHPATHCNTLQHAATHCHTLCSYKPAIQSPAPKPPRAL